MVERDEYGRPASLPNGFKPWPVTPTEERDEWSVVRLYNQGFAGAFRDPDADEEFLSGLQYKTFGDAASANPGLGLARARRLCCIGT
jgi:hypothetical protein